MTSVPWRPPGLRLRPRTVLLNDAQARVLTALFTGACPQQMADDWQVSVHTVKSRQKRLYRSLGVHNAAQAVAIVASGRVLVLVDESRAAA